MADLSKVLPKTLGKVMPRIVGGYSNPPNSVANYLLGDRQDLINNVDGVTTISVAPTAVFNSNGLSLDSSFVANIDTTGFPTTDVRITILFIYNSKDSSFSRAFDSKADANNRSQLFNDSGTKWRFRSTVSGSTETIDSIQALPNAGELVTAIIDVKSDSGTTLTVNGVASTENANVTSIVYDTDLILLNWADDNTKAINGDVVQFLVQNI